MSVKTEYIEILRQIDKLYRSGKGDGDEADDLNNKADILWNKLLREDQVDIDKQIENGTL